MANNKGNQIIPDNTGKTYQTSKPNMKAGIFKTFYLDPTSDTFLNVRGSAIRAGYSELYASNITVQKPAWWVELTESAEAERAEMLGQAQKNIKKTLKNNPESDTDKKLQHDASKFVSERLGKEHYSTRQELTDKGGKRLFNVKDNEDSNVLTELFKGVEAPEAA